MSQVLDISIAPIIDLHLQIEDPINLVPEAVPSLVKGADGLSAYEVAVENGFEGTEAEWLESLKSTSATDHDHEIDNQVLLFENQLI